MYVVGYPARTAVPLNLAVSLVTLAFALVVRSRAVSVGALIPYLNDVAGLAIGALQARFMERGLSARSKTSTSSRQCLLSIDEYQSQKTAEWGGGRRPLG
jgi:hypothetical protein